MSDDDLKKALRSAALAKGLNADQSPLALLARQMGVTVEELAAELLKELVALMKAIEPLPNSPPTSLNFTENQKKEATRCQLSP